VSGRWHVHAVLPGGQPVAADYREPVTDALARWNAGMAEPSDLETINKWWQEHAVQSENCRRGVCDHLV
jgi:hypothetical protein